MFSNIWNAIVDSSSTRYNSPDGLQNYFLNNDNPDMVPLKKFISDRSKKREKMKSDFASELPQNEPAREFQRLPR